MINGVEVNDLHPALSLTGHRLLGSNLMLSNFGSVHLSIK